ncbi:MAG TPA: DinB family protein [Acidimicrobiales bacterium]|jgi:hypothetical protein|nr:DinB family protein [Acidimicrobiales bacterium]
MPGLVPPLADEREVLLAFLGQQRDALRYAAHGLSDEQASTRSTVSDLCLAGLIKHAALVEQAWATFVSTGDTTVFVPQDDWADGFRLVNGETVDDVLALAAEQAGHTEKVVAELPDLGVPLPPTADVVPWIPGGVSWTPRWVLLHLIEETARHAGHADIIREAIDGATGWTLMAAAEGWPATDWA